MYLVAPTHRRQRQFMSVLPAHIVALKHTKRRDEFLHSSYIVLSFDGNTSQNLQHIFNRN